MISSTSDNSDRSMELPPTSSGSGSRASDSEQRLADLQHKHSATALFEGAQALNLGPTTSFGTPEKLLPFSMPCVIQGPFVIRSNGSLGQEILDSNGETIAWTTDPWVAQVISKLLTDNEELLG